LSKRRSKKRVRKPNLPPEAFQAVRADAEARPPGVARSRQDFNPDYAYVIQDLKRIGILAGAFITLLVVLSFFLN
jgi:hypothetical protein